MTPKLPIGLMFCLLLLLAAAGPAAAAHAVRPAPAASVDVVQIHPGVDGVADGDIDWP
ncbi:hypothetical protein F4558_004694 [Micromonospora profundi]|uniref:hypothetical protein n=1 Tax=Micromonospora profundi TaxID=1420889 RepID=UPI00143C43D6|nr:hypothetical protein [Micromonospora profundi]NJC14868.1 hypothetical protein [Micromonospora profundi]